MSKDFSFFLSLELSKCDQPVKLISMKSNSIIYDFFILAGTLNYRLAKAASPISIIIMQNQTKEKFFSQI